MKLAQCLLWSLLFGSAAVANEVNMSWQWQSADGQRKHLQLTTDERVLSASRHEMTQLDTALNYPLETLYSYISPRLYNSINQINSAGFSNQQAMKKIKNSKVVNNSNKLGVGNIVKA